MVRQALGENGGANTAYKYRQRAVNLSAYETPREQQSWLAAERVRKCGMWLR
jgi:hypothetical protein